MSLETRVMEELKQAMRAKDQGRLRSLRAIKSAILLAKTEKGDHELDEAGELRLLQKLVKQREDSAAMYREQGREDLAGDEQEEIDVISAYLPAQLSDDDLQQAVQAIISETGASGPSDIGKVMGMAMKRLAGQADGKRISALARELLA